MTMPASPTAADAANWWSTGVSRIEPDVIQYRGYPVQELIGAVSFVDTIWLLVRGDLPTPAQSALLEAALMSGADHGPQAPSIAVARMAITCGIGLNGAMASAVNTLGDVHGGAGQECLGLLHGMQRRVDAGQDRAEVADSIVAGYRERGGFVPGFGHRFHRHDPRRDPLLALLQEAAGRGEISGDHLANITALESALARRGSKPVPMNIDGATATIYAELGFEPELARGLFVLSRSVGILAHAWEESGSRRRIKGPLPPPMTAPYTGHAERHLPGH
jgi:citrate synthase